MKFIDILPSFASGCQIRRRSWDHSRVIDKDSALCMNGKDILASDWEIVNSQFNEALNAMLLGHKHIRRACAANPAESRICYVDGSLYIGMGTSVARKYEFSDSDVLALDWIVEE